MSKRVTELFLFDVFVAILKIERVAGKFENGDNLQCNYVSWDSVIREFEIIGEATSNLIKQEILKNESQVVVDFRNLLYFLYRSFNPGALTSTCVQ